MVRGQLSKAQSDKITAFLRKWARAIDYYAYQYSKEPIVSKADMISAFYENLCVHILSEHDIDDFGATAFVKNSMYRIMLRYFYKHSNEVNLEMSDSELNDGSIVHPSYEYEPMKATDLQLELEHALKKKGWKESWADILKLKMSGYNEREIADIYGVTRQAISYILMKILPDHKEYNKTK